MSNRRFYEIIEKKTGLKLTGFTLGVPNNHSKRIGEFRHRGLTFEDRDSALLFLLNQKAKFSESDWDDFLKKIEIVFWEVESTPTVDVDMVKTLDELWDAFHMNTNLTTSVKDFYLKYRKQVANFDSVFVCTKTATPVIEKWLQEQDQKYIRRNCIFATNDSTMDLIKLLFHAELDNQNLYSVPIAKLKEIFVEHNPIQIS